jgi:2-aminoethylphosphonate-pyruvate transaminase
MQGKGTFRLCALGAIDAPDIEAFWEVFKEALAKYDVKVPVKYN